MPDSILLITFKDKAQSSPRLLHSRGTNCGYGTPQACNSGEPAVLNEDQKVTSNDQTVISITLYS